MLRAIVVSPEPELGEMLGGLLRELGQIALTRSKEQVPVRDGRLDINGYLHLK